MPLVKYGRFTAIIEISGVIPGSISKNSRPLIKDYTREMSVCQLI